MPDDLKSRSIAALGWSAIDIGGRQGIQFMVTLVLARLLSPADFGLIGMLSLFIAVASSLVDSGFGSALIQRKSVTEEDKSSVFFFNLAIGACMALTVSLAAPWIAAFYRQPILLPLTRLLAWNLFIGSFGAIQMALLTRELNFRTTCRASVVASAVSGIAAMWMAWRGFGVWSLAAQSLIATSVSTGLLWVLHPWRPIFRFSFGSLRSLFGFGSRLLASGLLDTSFDRIQLAVIGKAFSAVQLGFYTRAFSTQQVPASVLSAVVSRVTFPLFSQMSATQRALKPGVRKALVALMIPTLPMMIGMALVARPLVLVLFGAKWLPCVPYLQILSIAGALWPLHVINLNVLVALGRSDLFFRLEILKKLLIGAALLVTFRISVMAITWGVLIVSVACVFLNSFYSKALIGYGLRDQLKDLAPYAAVSASMGAITWCARALLSHLPAIHLAVAVLASAVFYCAICHLLKLESYRSLLGYALAVLPKRQVVVAS